MQVLRAVFVLFCLYCLLAITRVAGAQDGVENLLAAPDEVVVNDVPVRVETDAYLNLMPRTVNPEHLLDCSREGPLIVPVNLKAPACTSLPPDVVVDSVWVISGDTQWSGRLQSKDRIDSTWLARGCPEQIIQPGAPIRVVVRIVGASEFYYIRSAQEKIKAAY